MRKTVSEQISISVAEWLAGDTGSAAEQATNAELSIRIGNHEVTEVEDFESKTVRRTVRVSAFLAANWLVANWWRLRWEPEPSLSSREDFNWAMSHSMSAIGSGFAWPDLVLRGSDGSHIHAICSRNSASDSGVLTPIRYLNSFSTSVDVDSFEAASYDFVETVIARLHTCGIRKSILHDLWDDLRYEKGNAKAASYRKLEALLGLDPDEDDSLVGSISKWSKVYGKQALEEIAASTDRARIVSVLAGARRAAQGVRNFAEVPNLTEIAADVVPWQQGQAAAYALRKKWEFGIEPISDEALAERMNISVNKLLDVKENVPFSFALGNGTTGKLGFVLNRPQATSRRFDTARLIGDFIGFDIADSLRPATVATTSRQKYQRAFAAEFLCPSEMIRERFSGGLDQGEIGDAVAELSAEYKVAGQVVLHHMQNRNVLPYGLGQTSLLLA